MSPCYDLDVILKEHLERWLDAQEEEQEQEQPPSGSPPGALTRAVLLDPRHRAQRFEAALLAYAVQTSAKAAAGRVAGGSAAEEGVAAATAAAAAAARASRLLEAIGVPELADARRNEGLASWIDPAADTLVLLSQVLLHPASSAGSSSSGSSRGDLCEAFPPEWRAPLAAVALEASALMPASAPVQEALLDIANNLVVDMEGCGDGDEKAAAAVGLLECMLGAWSRMSSREPTLGPELQETMGRVLISILCVLGDITEP